MRKYILSFMEKNEGFIILTSSILRLVGSYSSPVYLAVSLLADYS
ncbi:hypothetical protein [Bacillus sp. PK3_68]|nr:hypothetical protein [Bacillus sp. PK3_68]